jgi:hypothetical protein
MTTHKDMDISVGLKCTFWWWGRTLTEKGLVCSASNVHVVPLTWPYIYTISYRNGLYSISNIDIATRNISSRTTIFTAIRQNSLYKTNIDILTLKGLERNQAICQHMCVCISLH